MSEIPVLYGQYDDEGNPLWMDGAVRQMFALRAENARLREALKLILKLAIRNGMRWGPAISDAEDALSGETVETKK